MSNASNSALIIEGKKMQGSCKKKSESVMVKSKKAIWCPNENRIKNKWDPSVLGVQSHQCAQKMGSVKKWRKRTK